MNEPSLAHAEPTFATWAFSLTFVHKFYIFYGGANSARQVGRNAKIDHSDLTAASLVGVFRRMSLAVGKSSFDTFAACAAGAPGGIEPCERSSQSTAEWRGSYCDN